MRKTIGDIISEAPDLRVAYAPLVLSEKSAHPVRDVMAEIGGWIMMLTVIGIMVVGGVFVTQQGNDRSAQYQAERRQAEQRYLKEVERRNILRAQELCVARTYRKMEWCEQHGLNIYDP